MSSNNQPLSGNSFVPIQRSSLNSLITSIILDSDTANSSFLIRTGDNSSFYIDKYSNVGINTTSPGTQLEVASANGSCLRLRYGATSALANIYVSSGGNLSLNPSGGELNTNGNFNISAHNGSTTGLMLNGTLVLSSAAQLNYMTVTAGTAAASKAVVLDNNRDITNIRYLTASQLTGTIQTAAQPNITTVGTLTSLTVGDIEITGSLTVSGSGGSINTALEYLTGITPGTALASKALVLDSSANIVGISGIGTTSITIGGNTIGATQSAYLTGITTGTATASKALIVDGSRDISNIRYLTASQLTGELQTAAQPNITSIGTLTTLTIGSSILGNTEAAYLTSIGAGTAAAGKALVLDGSRDITNIRNLTATNLYGIIQTSSQSNITSVGTLTQLTISGATALTSTIDATSSTAGGALTIDGGLAVAKAAFIGTNLTVGGNLIVSGTTTTVNSSTVAIKDNVILLNSSPAGSYDGGIIVQRYQPISNTIIGDVVADTAKETTTVVSATSNTVVLTTGNAADNYYNGWWVKINSDIRYVSGYVGSTKTVTVSTTFSSTPTASTAVSLYNRSNAAFTWNEANKQFAATYNANDSSTALTTLDYADMKVAGLYTLNPINISDATESSSTSTGSIITLGGVGIAKALRVGNGIYGTIQTAAQTSITSVGTLSSLVVSGSITTNGATFSSTEINYLLSLSPGTATASKALVLDSNSNIAGIASISATSATIGGNVIGATQSAYLTGISAGTVSAGKALVVDGSRNIININALTASQLTGTLQTASQPNITSIGTLTNITIGSNTLSNTEAAYLTSITEGTASASKALVVDANKDITSIRYLTATQLTGTLQTAAQPNITSIGTLTNLTIGSNTLSNTEAAYLTSITAGTASASKALILDSSTNITGINSIGTTTLVLGGTSLGTTQAAYLTSITPGTAAASKALVIDSSKNISGLGVIASSFENNTSTQVSYQTWTNSLGTPIVVNLAISNAAPVFGTASNHRMRFITNATVQMWMQTSGNVSIGVDSDTYKLNVNGSFNATSYYSSGTLVSFSSIAGVTDGTASANKAVILDASTSITGINSIGTTTLVLGGNSLGATQSGYITGVTAGTATAGKALIVDGSVNIAGINSLSTTSLTVNGTDVSAAITASGYVTGITPGTGSASKALVLDSSSNITTGVNSFATTTLVLGGNSLGATESAYLTSITAGTAAASKALIVDGSRNIVNINALTATQLTGTLQTAAQTNITSVGTLTGLTVSTSSNGGISLRKTDASTTSIAYPLEVCHYLSSGNGGVGIGAGMTFNATNGSGSVISYGRIYAVSSDVTHNAHAGGLGFSTVISGNFADVLTLTSSSTTNSTLTLIGASSTISATNLTGTLTTAAQPSITSVGTLTSLATGNITLNGTLISATAAEINYTAGVTAGTAIASKSLVLDSSKNIAGVGSIGLTGGNIMLDLYAATSSAKSAVTLRNDTRTIEYGLMGTTAAAKANMFYIFNNAAYALLIDSNSNIGIGVDPNSSYKLNTTTVNATSYYVSGSLVDLSSVSYLSGITPGTVSASKAIVVDSSSNITSGLNSVTMSTLVLGSTIISSSEIAVIDGVTPGTAANSKALVLNGSGSITGITSISSTTVTIGGSQLDGTEAGYLDSVVAGTAAASKALVLNASSNITTGINSLTMSSLILGSNTLSSTEAGYLTSITSGTAAASKALVLNSSSNITTGVNSFATTTLVLGGNSLGATESAYLTSITAGTAAASKALVLNSSSNITTGLNSLTATSLVTTNFSLGGTSVTATAAQLNFLSGVTAGTAAASKALVLNSSSIITTGISSLSVGIGRTYTSGTQCANIVIPSQTFVNQNSGGTDSTFQSVLSIASTGLNAPNAGGNPIVTTNAATVYIAGAFGIGSNISITNNYALYVAAGTSFFGSTISMNGTLFTSTQAGYLSGITAGTAAASKALVLDSSSNITGINNLSIDGVLTVGTSGSSDNRINFKGVSGDSSDNFTVLAERLYNGTDISELLLFKGNDLSTGGSGPDRIRLRAPQIVFQVAGEIYSALADNNTIMAIQNDNSVAINTILSIGTSRNYANSAFGANINVNDCTLSNSYTAASSTDSGHYKKVSIGVSTLTTAVNTAVTTTNASSLFIQSAPVAGTRMTITNAYALYVNSGKAFFGGETTINSGGNSGLRLINSNNGVSDNCNILFTNNNRSFELGIRSAAAGTGPANGFYIYDNANAAMRFTIASTGNVGIGHNAPQARLDMGLTAADRILAVFAGASGGDFYGFGANNNVALYHTKSSHTFYAGSTVGATGTQVFTVGSDGNAFASAGLHASGYSVLSSGAGAHIHYALSQAQFFGYDYSAGQYKDVSINSGSIYAKTSAGAIGFGVGINTTTMNAALTVLGNSNFLDGSYNKCIQAIGAGGVSIMIEPHSGSSGTTTNAGWIGTSTTNDLRLGTDNATRMTILSGGNVGIGTNSPGVLLDVNGIASGVRIRATSGSASACFIGGWDDSGYWGLGEHGGADTVRLGKCDSSGSWSSGRSSLAVQTLFYAGSLTSDSDYRLKTDITPLSYGLNEILNLNPKKYKLLSDDKIYYGLIAHEVQEQLPEIVIGEKDKINDNNEPVYQGVDYVKITPVLINAIKELHTKNVELEQTIQNQNNLINDILARLQQLEN